MTNPADVMGAFFRCQAPGAAPESLMGLVDALMSRFAPGDYARAAREAVEEWDDGSSDDFGTAWMAVAVSCAGDGRVALARQICEAVRDGAMPHRGKHDGAAFLVDMAGTVMGMIDSGEL